MPDSARVSLWLLPGSEQHDAALWGGRFPAGKYDGLFRSHAHDEERQEEEKVHHFAVSSASFVRLRF